jgi:hypothetical protein
VDDGVSRRVDRLRALGNTIVPYLVYQFLRGIVDIEKARGAI